MQVDCFETKELIQKVSKQEFLAHGFKKSNIRSIAKKVGITPGAIYKHYLSKEEIFEDLVGDVAIQVFTLSQVAFEQSIQLIQKDAEAFLNRSVDYDEPLFDYIMTHRVELKLLLFKSDGTAYESFKDDLIYNEVKSHKEIVSYLKQFGYQLPHYSDDALFIIYSTCFNPFFEAIRLSLTQDELNMYMDIMLEASDFAWRLFLKDMKVEKIG